MERTGKGLAAREKMAFQHEGMDGFCTALNLSQHIIQNLWLAGGIFAAVCMAAIDHQGTGSIDIAKQCFCLFDKIRGKIRSGRATPQN